MPRIPFMLAHVPGALPSVESVTRRLERFLRNLRDTADVSEDPDFFGGSRLSDDDRMLIARRAEVYVARLRGKTGLDHLSSVEIKPLLALRDGVPIVSLAGPHAPDEIGAQLEAEMPWMNLANEAVWLALRRSERLSEPGIRLPPMLLVGPAGIGKSRWARRVAEILALPSAVVEATGEPASFAVVGTQKGWGSAGTGRLIQTVIANQVANPVMVIDEIEKAGDVRSTGGSRFTLTDALLPLLERSTAGRWSCPFYRVSFDMSWVSWILTANGIRGLPGPLLSRCPPLHLPDLTAAQITGFASREAARRGLPEDVVSVILDALVARGWSQAPSLRTAIRMIERAEAVMERPTLH